MKELYERHLQARTSGTAKILEVMDMPGIVIGAGPATYYPFDDQVVPFRAVPHFSHWCPAPGPGHLIKYVPGQTPVLIGLEAATFWHEPDPIVQPLWADAFDVQLRSTEDEVWSELGVVDGFGYIGNQTDRAEAKGLVVDNKEFLARMDWERAAKSEYEIDCLIEANKLGAVAHRAARSAFSADRTELEIYYEYIKSLGVTDNELPYGAIVACDEKAAVLHYEHKRQVSGRVLLIDAGAGFQNYGSDITRTYARASCPQVFRDLLVGMERLQQDLCSFATSRIGFRDLNERCLLAIGDLLLRCQVIHGCTTEEALANGVTSTFMPHGVSHYLGVQTHDVSGFQKNPQGDPVDPCPKYARLRGGRMFRDNEVITVEPGLYFIASLLAKLKDDTARTKLVNWPLVEELTPYGGIRIEDNVLIREQGSVNLTRKHLGNDLIIA